MVVSATMDINDILTLARQIERIQNAASDLWTWLPDYDIKKDTPSADTVMYGACEELHRLRKLLEENGVKYELSKVSVD